MNMKRNVGFIDRIIRFILAGAMILFAYIGGFQAFKAAILLYFVAAFILLTVITGSCPLYTITKTNTIKKSNKK